MPKTSSTSNRSVSELNELSKSYQSFNVNTESHKKIKQQIDKKRGMDPSLSDKEKQRRKNQAIFARNAQENPKYATTSQLTRGYTSASLPSLETAHKARKNLLDGFNNVSVKINFTRQAEASKFIEDLRSSTTSHYLVINSNHAAPSSTTLRSVSPADSSSSSRILNTRAQASIPNAKADQKQTNTTFYDITFADGASGQCTINGSTVEFSSHKNEHTTDAQFITNLHEAISPCLPNNTSVEAKTGKFPYQSLHEFIKELHTTNTALVKSIEQSNMMMPSAPHYTLSSSLFDAAATLSTPAASSTSHQKDVKHTKVNGKKKEKEETDSESTINSTPTSTPPDSPPTLKASESKRFITPATPPLKAKKKVGFSNETTVFEFDKTESPNTRGETSIGKTKP